MLQSGVWSWWGAFRRALEDLTSNENVLSRHLGLGFTTLFRCTFLVGGTNGVRSSMQSTFGFRVHYMINYFLLVVMYLYMNVDRLRVRRVYTIMYIVSCDISFVIAVHVIAVHVEFSFIV